MVRFVGLNSILSLDTVVAEPAREPVHVVLLDRRVRSTAGTLQYLPSRAMPDPTVPSLRAQGTEHLEGVSVQASFRIQGIDVTGLNFRLPFRREVVSLALDVDRMASNQVLS